MKLFICKDLLVEIRCITIIGIPQHWELTRYVMTNKCFSRKGQVHGNIMTSCLDRCAYKTYVGTLRWRVIYFRSHVTLIRVHLQRLVADTQLNNPGQFVDIDFRFVCGGPFFSDASIV